MRIVLTAHSFVRGASGSIGDTLEVTDSLAESMVARGAAKLWQPEKEKPKSVNERLAALEAKLSSLETMIRTGTDED